ncbi:MAG: PAS domain-containing protein, partial [Chloroflexaceae bacterium]|nr:PAS domain-containing protein [Chloroflexaceae bacterium]
MANKSLADDTAALHARIADLEQYNATLKQDLQLLRTIIDTISSPIYAKDRDFRFIVANQAVADLLGMQPSDMLGKTDTELFGAENAAAWYESHRVPLEEGDSTHSEDYAMLPDGAHI